MSNPDPWEVHQDDYQDPWEAREEAINRGLRACGFNVDENVDTPSDRWPRWAAQAYFSFPPSVEVTAVRVLAEGPPEMRDAVEAAYALGGSQAVNDLLWPVIRAYRGEAQGKLTGGLNRSEETA
jgi:hypothetical protein